MGQDSHAPPRDPLSRGTISEEPTHGPVEDSGVTSTDVGESEVSMVVSVDEANLVAAAKAGDEGAFAELVRLTHTSTYTMAYRLMGNEDDARDVVQDVYLRAFRSLKRFRGDARFSTWLYRITANSAATHLARRKKDRHDEIGPEEAVADSRPDSDPQLRAEAGVLRDRVNSALAELPEKLRAVVVLRDVYDMSHESIAEELGISEAAAKVRLHRARRKLREKLYPMPGEGEERARAV